jgi:hypothetical protein
MPEAKSGTTVETYEGLGSHGALEPLLDKVFL